MEWAVIFDWDGVVVDSSEAHRLSWEQTAMEANLPLPDDHMARGFGKKNATIIPDILEWTRDVREIKHLSDKKEKNYREKLASGHGSLLPGARDLLDNLKMAGVACVVGSSTDRANIEQAICQFSLQGYFRDIAASEDCEAGKPAPDVFLAAAAKIGIPPENCVVIEDAPYGIEAAHRAGMKAIALLTSHKQSTMSQADLIVEDLRALDPEAIHSLIPNPL
jgi:HAD superfamily hydrolase (TIGR01509 family)